MGSRTFVDTNVFLYLYDVGEPAKSRMATQAMRSLESGDVVLSTQVLQEFYWNATRKLEPAVSPERAARVVAELATYLVVQIDVPLILAAIARSESGQIAMWDALIVESALSAGCERLLSEDLQHGHQFDGLRVENPFA